MQCCATCGETQELRLYLIEIADQVEQRWWCLGCRDTARLGGVTAELAPVWIERAARQGLPLKVSASGWPSASGLGIAPTNGPPRATIVIEPSSGD